MTSSRQDFETFYQSQTEAHRLSYSVERFRDRLTEPAVVLTVLFLLFAILYQLAPGQSVLESAASSLGNYLWHVLVLVTPAHLIHALDKCSKTSSLRSMNETQPTTTYGAKSAAMRRILGLEHPSGMIASVLQARNRAFSATGNALGLKPNIQRPAGLGNRDNSCYQNSILQGLASLPPFSRYLSTYLKASGDESSSKEVVQALRTLLSDLIDASNNGKTLWTPRVLKSMSTWTQQDAQEYYSKILDDIDKAAAKVALASQRPHGLESDQMRGEATSSQHSDDSGYQSASCSPKVSDIRSSRNPLEGLLAQRVTCVQCGYLDGLSMIPFNCLTLSLGLDKHSHDLYDRLDAFCNIESIDGVECPKCTLLKAKRLLTELLEKLREGSSEQLQMPLQRLRAVETALEEEDFDDETIINKCKISPQGKVLATKTKQIVVARTPQSLVIHVNRSVFDPLTFDMLKNSAPVKFPTTLDLGPWCLGSAAALTSKPETEDQSAQVDKETWLSDANSSMVAGDLRPSRLTGPIYELRAVVTHYGRHENGHYICYRKHSKPASAPDRETSEGVLESVDETPGDRADDGNLAKHVPGDDVNPEDGDGSDWWRLSDHNVSKVDKDTISSLAPGVFMLFYDCVDPNTTFNPNFSAAAGPHTVDQDGPCKIADALCPDGATVCRLGEVSEDELGPASTGNSAETASGE